MVEVRFRGFGQGGFCTAIGLERSGMHKEELSDKWQTLVVFKLDFFY